jgi:RNA polymerase sigma factor (TIGR02999 family)
VTQLLQRASGGDRDAYDRLFSLAYAELERVAERQLRGPRSLSAAELVSELYLKLGSQLRGDWQGRAHFYAIAARAMRQILVDAARRRASAKRGGSWVATTLSGKQLAAEVSADELLAIDELLGHLDERQRRVVECRFFGGMSDDEIGEALGVSARPSSASG